MRLIITSKNEKNAEKIEFMFEQTVELDVAVGCCPLLDMATPSDENFKDYKKAERKALEVLAAMKTASARPNDIELALLVAIFELHKDSLVPDHIGGIIQDHLKQIIPFYQSRLPATD